MGKLSYEYTHYGDEPEITRKSTNIEMIHAYNWYGHYHMADDAKKYTLDYLSVSKKYNKEFIRTVSRINAVDLYNIGWNCRIISRGGSLPSEIEKKTFDSLELLVKAQKKEDIPTEAIPVINLQERVSAYASERIADIEDFIDSFLRHDKEEDIKSFFIRMNIKPQVAKIISDYYSPLYDELFLAYKRTDPQLKEAYSSWKRKRLKEYMEFIKTILVACEDQKNVVKTPRKARKKKIKPASVVVSKLLYAKDDKELGITSIKPEDIVTSKQLWVFNTKTRNLTVYNAIGDSCLSVKGTTVTGFDTNTSITKKIRKPKDILDKVLEFGKVPLKKVMDSIKAKASVTKGRINKDVLLVRTIK